MTIYMDDGGDRPIRLELVCDEDRPQAHDGISCALNDHATFSKVLCDVIPDPDEEGMDYINTVYAFRWLVSAAWKAGIAFAKNDDPHGRPETLAEFIDRVIPYPPDPNE